MCVIGLALDSYIIRQKSCGLWSNVKSRYFTMANEVISILFLSSYNPVLDRLRMSGFDCHI